MDGSSTFGVAELILLLLDDRIGIGRRGGEDRQRARSRKNCNGSDANLVADRIIRPDP